MPEEKKNEEQKPVETPPEQKPEGEKSEEKEPSYEELKNIVSGLKEKFVPKEVADSLKTELEGVKEQGKVVERIRKAISGDETPGEDEAKKAEFYKLLIRDPAAAIRQVIQEETTKARTEANEKMVEKEFKRFSVRFPEYKKFEDDMKAELLANPGWFGRPNFLQRVFFDVLSYRNPKLLKDIIDSGRAMVENEEGEFVFEGATQTDHGSGELTGKDIMDRMRSAGGKEKSFFE